MYQMLWKKPANIPRYVDLCIYVDKWMPIIANNRGKYPDEENRCYNYLFLIAKAIAMKHNYFNSFDDYDGFSFYVASRIYFAMLKSYENAGKLIKGKIRTPIKSCKNYMVSIFYPMKLCYMNDSFNKIISEEFAAKSFDSYMYTETLKSSALRQQDVVQTCNIYARDAIKHLGDYLDEVLKSTPFKHNSTDYINLKITLYLNLNRLIKEHEKLTTAPDSFRIYFWRLPKSMSGYIKTLMNEFITKLKTELIKSYEDTHMSSEILDKIVALPRGNVSEKSDYKE